jgi:hypothetical protein
VPFLSKPVFAVSINAVTSDGSSVAVVYVSGYIPPSSDLFVPTDILFTLADIADKFDELLKHWYENAAKIRPTYDLFAIIEYNPPAYAETELLLLSQALESFHRRVYNGTYIEGGSFTILYEDFMEAATRPRPIFSRSLEVTSHLQQPKTSGSNMRPQRGVKHCECYACAYNLL